MLRWWWQRASTMRFIWIYLVVYFTLIAGALVALWHGGVLARLSPLWTLAAIVLAVGLGALLAVVSALHANASS